MQQSPMVIPDPQPERGSRRVFGACAFIALASVALFAPPAAACPITDPTCVIEETKKTVEETVDDAERDATEAIDGTQDTARETVDTVEEDVAETVGPVLETVIPEGPETPRRPPTAPEPPKRSDRKSRDPRVAGRQEVSSGLQTDLRTTRIGAARAAELGAARASLLPDVVGPSTAPAEARLPSKSPLDAAIETAKQLVFPLILSIVVGLFLAVQHYWDRRDPKIALAPLDSDILRFE